MPYLSNPQGPSPVQKAIQTLSLRMPPRTGGQSGAWPYPPAFYGPQAQGSSAGGAPGGMGMAPNPAPNPALLEAIRRMLFGNAPMNNSMPAPGAAGGAAPLANAPAMPPSAPMGGRFGTQPLPTSPALPTPPPRFTGGQGPPDQPLNPSAQPTGNIDDFIQSLFGPR